MRQTAQGCNVSVVIRPLVEIDELIVRQFLDVDASHPRRRPRPRRLHHLPAGQIRPASHTASSLPAPSPRRSATCSPSKTSSLPPPPPRSTSHSARDEQRALADHGTTFPEAYQYFLQGRGYLLEAYTPETFKSAQTMFKEALRIDPSYGAAKAGLGESWLYAYNNHHQSADIAQARRHAAMPSRWGMPEQTVTSAWAGSHERRESSRCCERVPESIATGAG